MLDYEKVKYYCNAKCWYFVFAVFVSLVLLFCAVLGMLGVFSPSIDECFFTGLLGTVFGVWVPTPNFRNSGNQGLNTDKEEEDSSAQCSSSGKKKKQHNTKISNA